MYWCFLLRLEFRTVTPHNNIKRTTFCVTFTPRTYSQGHPTVVGRHEAHGRVPRLVEQKLHPANARGDPIVVERVIKSIKSGVPIFYLADSLPDVLRENDTEGGPRVRCLPLIFASSDDISVAFW